MNVDKRTFLFTGLFFLIIILGTFPGPFDWSNRVYPMVLGIPFSYFWQILLNIILFALLIIWYSTESKTGDLDIDIEEVESIDPWENN